MLRQTHAPERQGSLHMRNHILTVAAISTLMAGSALAQTMAPSNTTPPAATQTAPGSAPGAKTDMNTRAGTAMPGQTTTTAAGTFIDAQNREQWLATTLIGTRVNGAADENLGEVNDVLMDRNGNIIGAVIGVGGFLGVGEKDVAVPFNNLELVRNSEGDKLILRKTKDELNAAPEFKEYTDNSTRAPAAATGTESRPMTTPPATTTR
ncbi:MAG: hypothetical protein B7Y84_05075 [Azorhizobium sp. 32-67-21]|nr:MAG: hypothetical protein B7Y84_05075 [Azorhizobium sp. 32-67-21]